MIWTFSSRGVFIIDKLVHYLDNNHNATTTKARSKGHKPGVRPSYSGLAWRRILAKGLIRRDRDYFEKVFHALRSLIATVVRRPQRLPSLSMQRMGIPLGYLDVGS